MKITNKTILVILLLINLLFMSCNNLFFCVCNATNINGDVFSIFKNEYHVLNVIPVYPKIRSLNWEIILSPFVQQILFINDIEPGSTLLISNVKNNTNGELYTDQITFTLINLISESNKFIVIKKKQLDDVYSSLGLKWEDNLESCNKAMGLGRLLQTKYLLFCTLQGDTKQPYLELQLILVNTGEIIWSYKNYV